MFPYALVLKRVLKKVSEIFRVPSVLVPKSVFFKSSEISKGAGRRRRAVAEGNFVPVCFNTENRFEKHCPKFSKAEGGTGGWWQRAVAEGGSGVQLCFCLL